MKKTMIALALLALSAGAVQANTPNNPDANRCIREQDIRNTTTPNSRTILFHMRDGTVWRNTLRNSCSGLAWDGFVHRNFGGVNEYCGNKEIVKSIQTGQSCVLGDFTREPPKKPRS